MNKHFLPALSLAFLMTAVLSMGVPGYAENNEETKPEADSQEAEEPQPEVEPDLPMTDTEVPEPDAPQPRLILDLRKDGFEYAYETWEGQVVQREEGIIVAGQATGHGGLGTRQELDLTGFTYIELALAVGENNHVGAVTVNFEDKKGVTASARYNVSQLSPNIPVWLRIPLEDFLSPEAADVPAAFRRGREGRFPTIDPAAVVHWQIQGDWSTRGPCRMILIAMRGIP